VGEGESELVQEGWSQGIRRRIRQKQKERVGASLRIEKSTKARASPKFQEDIDYLPIFTREGASWAGVNKVFGGDLETVITEINSAIPA
jgi:hypothetical protein